MLYQYFYPFVNQSIKEANIGLLLLLLRTSFSHDLDVMIITSTNVTNTRMNFRFIHCQLGPISLQARLTLSRVEYLFGRLYETWNGEDSSVQVPIRCGIRCLLIRIKIRCRFYDLVLFLKYHLWLRTFEKYNYGIAVLISVSDPFSGLMGSKVTPGHRFFR